MKTPSRDRRLVCDDDDSEWITAACHGRAPLNAGMIYWLAIGYRNKDQSNRKEKDSDELEVLLWEPASCSPLQLHADWF